jgi:thiol-disulfide isomerase/thioredoxin
MKEIYITLYKAEWCGYCKRFKPDWEKFQNIINNNSIQKELTKENIKVFFDTYDDAENRDVILRAKIKYYPTLKVTIKEDNKKETFDIESEERELSILTKKLFGKSDNLINMIINEINSNKKLSGGYFDYINKPELKYYKEYLKCRNKYLALKSK